MNNYFREVSTVESVKSLYRKLAMRLHPDRGGDTATMQELNEQYHRKLRTCDGQERQVNDQTWTYTYNHDSEQEIMNTIDATLKAKILNPNHNFDLIGKWLWITGDTRPIKDALKRLGYRWHSKRQAWYWRPAGSKRRRYNKNVSLSDIAARYGASSILIKNEEDRKQVSA